MSLPRSIEIDGRRYVWRDLVASRCAHAKPLAEQPTCSRGATIPPGWRRSAAERYREPSLFTRLGWEERRLHRCCVAAPWLLVCPFAPYHFIEISKS